MRAGYPYPINLGSDRLIAIKDLAEMIRKISGKELEFRFDLTGPQGVRGRNSDNTLLKEVTGWEPEISLEEGMETTYRWIHNHIHE